MNKKKIIIVLSLVIVIASVIIGFMLMNHEEHTDEVKKYEVVEDRNSIQLKVLEEIDPPKFKSNIKENMPLSSVKKDLSMQYILNIIKDYDKNFEEKDYTFTCHGTNVYNYITLFYHIGEIETNKSYSVIVKDSKIDYIFAGISNKETMDNITKEEKTKLLELVSNFKGDYKSQKIYEARKELFKSDKVLKKDGNIDTKNMKVDVKKIEEKFLYFFDEEKLHYEAIVDIEENDDEPSEGIAIQVVLN